VNSNNHLRQEELEQLPSSCRQKKGSSARAVLVSLDTNQEGLLLREARSQKRKFISPTPQEEKLDQEIRDLEAIHQQLERRREKMLRLAEL
jgi:16S rRNA C967 or C1407 C5-methylase (RsmB/RsmF family)